MKLVLANGCFDLLHAGHVSHLKAARSMGDVLIVSLTLDADVNKPGRPIYPWEERAQILRELRCVDFVVPSSHAIDAILNVRPDIFVKGIDYKDFRFDDGVYEACRKVGAVIRFTTTPKMSTTDTLRKICG